MIGRLQEGDLVRIDAVQGELTIEVDAAAQRDVSPSGPGPPLATFFRSSSLRQLRCGAVATRQSRFKKSSVPGSVAEGRPQLRSESTHSHHLFYIFHCESAQRACGAGHPAIIILMTTAL